MCFKQSCFLTCLSNRGGKGGTFWPCYAAIIFYTVNDWVWGQHMNHWSQRWKCYLRPQTEAYNINFRSNNSYVAQIPVNDCFVIGYSSLKIYDVNMPVTSSFVSYQIQLFLHSSSAISDLPNLDKNSNSFDVGLVDRSTLKLSDWLKNIRLIWLFIRKIHIEKYF